MSLCILRVFPFLLSFSVSIPGSGPVSGSVLF